MDPVTNTTAGTTSNAPATKPDARTRLTSFEEKLKAAGATLEKVAGHAYGRVNGGTHDGELVNTSGNARSGELFEVVHRHGRTFHVYGSGDHRLFIGMPARTGGTEAAS
jgi:hypothetical protein